jgi:hypothetical protein
MKKLLTICPTRGRLNVLRNMVDSFVKTSVVSDLILCVDSDDPEVCEYRSLPCQIKVFEGRLTTTEMINRTWRAVEKYPYYSVTNDDFLYLTQGWDEKLIAAIGETGIAYGNDLLQGERLPTTSVISANIVLALGWLQMPTLKHLYGDEVWKHIGKELGILTYVDEVEIEHRHWIKDKSRMDETYKRTNSQELYGKDGSAFSLWKNYFAATDIENLRRQVCLGRSINDGI